MQAGDHASEFPYTYGGQSPARVSYFIFCPISVYSYRLIILFVGVPTIMQPIDIWQVLGTSQIAEITALLSTATSILFALRSNKADPEKTLKK
jgi:hypothetical protein